MLLCITFSGVNMTSLEAVQYNVLLDLSEFEMEETPSRTGLDFDDRLIVTVFENPLLWDMGWPDYKNKVKKDAVWRSIGAALGKTGEECRQRWKNLRERYGREIRKSNKRSGSGTDEICKVWVHMESMRFLKAQIKPRMNTKNNVRRDMQLTSDLDTSLPSSPSPSILQDDSASSSQGAFLNPTVEMETRKRIRPSKRKLVSSPDVIGKGLLYEIRSIRNFMENIGNYVQQRSAPVLQPHRIETFCQLIRDRYSLLPIAKQNRFDIAVLQLLMDLEGQ